MSNINNGSLNQSNITMMYSSANGYSFLTDTHALFNQTFSGYNGCWVFYDKEAALFYLINDGATGIAGSVPSGSGTASNSQCTLNGAGTSVSGLGNTLTMVLNVTFTPAFGAAQTVFMYALDQAGLNSGWQNRGTTATIVNSPPSVGTFNAVVAAPNQTLTATYTSVNGYQYINDAHLLTNGTSDQANACWVFYDKPTNAFYLAADSGNTFLGPLPVGSASTLSNTQCTLNGTGSSVSGTGNTLAMVVNVHFLFAGNKTAYMSAVDAGGRFSGWVANGTLTTP